MESCSRLHVGNLLHGPLSDCLELLQVLNKSSKRSISAHLNIGFGRKQEVGACPLRLFECPLFSPGSREGLDPNPGQGEAGMPGISGWLKNLYGRYVSERVQEPKLSLSSACFWK